MTYGTGNSRQSYGVGTPIDRQLKSYGCRQSQTLRRKIGTDFRKNWVEAIFGRSFVDDCLLFWVMVLLVFVNNKNVLTIRSTDYLLLINAHKQAK